MGFYSGEKNTFVSASASGSHVVPVDYIENNINWRSWIFFTDGTFTVSEGGMVEYLIVGGGGGGGGSRSGRRGGGGAGGQAISGNILLSAGTYSIFVGNGGNGGPEVTTTDPTTSPGDNGFSSSAFGFTAIGGGGGSNTSVSQYNGGGANQSGSGIVSGVSGSNKSGGDSNAHVTTGTRASGGGAGQMQDGFSAYVLDGVYGAGNGGIGLPSSISGQFKCYSNGGGGAIGVGVTGLGPFGAGNGINTSKNAIESHGDGGGGASEQNSGGNGGSGVVIIRYRLPVFNNNKLNIKFNDLPLFYYDAAFDYGYSVSNNIFYDLTGNKSNGSLINSATFSSNGGGSLAFNGSNQYIDTPIKWGNSGESFTFGGYARVNASTTSNFFIFSNYTASTVTPFYAITFNSSGASTSLWLRITSSNQSLITSPTSLSLNTWYYFIGVRDAENGVMSFYINGELVNTASFSGSANISNANNFGAVRHLSNYLNCNIGLMYFYNRALSGSEIQNHFNQTRNRFGL